MGVYSGQAKVAVPGTPVPLTATRMCKTLLVSPLPGNAGSVFLGGSDVSSTVGFVIARPLAASPVQVIPVTGVTDADQVMLDAATAGDGVSWLAVE